MDKDFLRQIDCVEELLPPEKIDDGVLICECFCVNAGDIRLTCSSTQQVELVLLQKELSLGLGCQTCVKRIDDWVDKIF